MVTHIVPFDPKQLQEAFEASLGGKNNVGKVVVLVAASNLSGAATTRK